MDRSEVAESKMSISQNSTPKRRSTTSIAKLRWWCREIVCIFAWLFVPTKLFVCDIDSLIVNATFPSLAPSLQFRFFLFLATLACCLLTMGARRFAFTCAYACFYPLVVTLRYVPAWFLRHWPLLLAFSPAIYSFIGSFRRSFALFAGAAVSGLLVLECDHKLLLIPASLYLAIYLARHCFRRYQRISRPTTVFADVASGIQKCSVVLKDATFQKQLAAKNDPTSSEKSNDTNNYLAIYAYLAMLEIGAKRFREIASSRKVDVYLASTLLFTMFVTVVIFAFEYLAISKLQPNSFTPATAGFFEFLSYSGSIFNSQSISGIQAHGPLATAASHCESAAFVAITFFGGFLVLCGSREQHKHDIDNVIEQLGMSTQELSVAVKSEFQMTLRDIEAILFRVHADTVNKLRKLRGLDELSLDNSSAANSDTTIDESVCVNVRVDDPLDKVSAGTVTDSGRSILVPGELLD
jgi:hypothetical protein